MSGQNSVGIKPNPVIRHDTKFMYDDFVLRNIDTSLYDFHRYNPILKANNPSFNLGNPGQKYHTVVYTPIYGTGFQTGQNLFDLYFRDVEQTRFFDTKTPFSDLSLNVGGEEEVSVRGVHTQNINPQLNFGLDYERNAAKGSFSRNKGVVQSLIVHTWFHTKNNSYHLMPSFSLNKVVIEENGGLAISDIFGANSGGTRLRENIPVNLDDAQNSRAIKALKLQQFIIPSLFKTKTDSSIVDTTSMEEKLRIGFTTRLIKNNFSYIDEENNTDYYANFFYDESETRDSFVLKQVEQEININDQFDLGGTKQKISLGLNYQFTNYKQYEVNRTIHDLKLRASWHANSNFKQRLSNQTSGELSLAPDYIGDVDIQNKFRVQLNSMMSLQLVSRFNNRSPSIKEQLWRSNHFYYYNYFEKEMIISNALLFNCSHGDINGELIHHYVKNFIFNGENILFEQSDEPLHVITFKANKLFDFKNFGMFSEIITQYNSNIDVLSIPTFYFRQNVYYKGGFFSGKVKANLGLDIWYHTNYKVYDYNPALAEFFIQKTQTEKYVPVVDAFFDIQIKKARVFLQMQNVAQGLGRKGYYVAVDHPGQDRTFKAGVRWQFYD